MSVDLRQLKQFEANLRTLQKATPKMMEQLTIGEGAYAAKDARRICKMDSPDIVNTGTYRENWHFGDHDAGSAKKRLHDGAPPRRRWRTYQIDVYNNLEYAGYLETGFRSHWVPGHWEGRSFVYEPGAKIGMYIGPKGGWVKGHWVLRRALEHIRSTQTPRLKKKLQWMLQEQMEAGL